MSLTPQFLDELRLRTPLSGLIGRSVKLTKAGREFKACCPFHNEKTPSFYVNDEKGFYHCFGCQAHGDAIRWLTDQRRLSFIDAVKELADAAGMEVPAADPRAQERAELAAGLYEVMEAAAEWFSEQLNGVEGSEVRAYLGQRGIGEPTRRKFGFGFAPDSRGKLKAALKRFGNEKLVECGLLIQPDEAGKEPYDRFRGRLMFPIRDPRGRCIAFSGRILGQGEPKYLNSPDTPIFDKGRTLFNFHQAGPASRKTKRVVVVEGQMDAVALDQAGIAEAVAPLGTALTENQMALLWRLLDVPILCFDGDSAGEKAAVRAAYRALPILAQGKSLDFAALPKGEDPDDVVRRGGRPELEAVLGNRTPLVQVLYRSEVSRGETATPEARASLRLRLNALAETCSGKVLQDEYRRALNGLFWDEFGWKGKERKVIASSILKTGPRGNRYLMNLFVRSALYGLSCFPQVVVAHTEAVGAIQMDHYDLQTWRETLVEAAIRKPSLDADGIQNALDTIKISPTQRLDMQYDLRFPHMRALVRPEDAMRRLTGLLEFLNEERSLDEELASLNAAVVRDPTLASYDAIELQRQAVREQRMTLLEKAYSLSQFDEAEG
ncbi:MAG: DNA primase [Alphaproteobacteria bacterium]|nr:MAG: DNA primase [Alphaproteobacteria bacterium]